MISTILLISCSQEKVEECKIDVDSFENQIYSAITNEWLKSKNYEGKKVIILNLTQNEFIDRAQSRTLSKLEKSLLEDFDNKNKETGLINYKLVISNPFEYIPQSKFDEIDKTNIYLLKENPLTKEFPDAGGIVGFSKIGFDKNFSKAIVYSFNWYDRGSFFLLKREMCNWKIESENNIWMH